ncbi:MAG: NRDE family protein [Burkholderiaceae bacterium]
MCLVALALDKSRRFPLVVAANRDEYFARPTANLAWWTPERGPAILGGRDLESGGTWLGLTAQGRLGLVTNVRDSRLTFDDAPSRGHIVPNWLAGRDPVDKFWMRTGIAGYNGFNLIAADFRSGECFWLSNGGSYPRRLERGIYGLSNAALDTPWPKVVSLRKKLVDGVESATGVDELASRLFIALSDRTVADDSQLPKTGISQDRERQLSPACIRMPDGLYGTRCSTVIVTERVNRYLVTHVLERTFSATGGQATLRRSTIRRWPPRYTSNSPTPAIEQAEVAEAEV